MSLVGSASFGLCALAFLILAALLLGRLRPGPAAILLTTAAGATCCWAAVVAWAAYSGGVPAYLGEALEVLRGAAWIAFLGYLVGDARRQRWSWAVKGLGALVLVPAAVVVANNVAAGSSIDLSAGIDSAFVLPGLLIAVAELLLLEQFYRNLPTERRWATKHLCLGLALIFTFDLYVYAQTLLFQALDPAAWQARGAINALAVPLIAVSAARNPTWSVSLFVSRHVAFHTATLIAAGVYLMVMSLGGYYIRDYGGTWGQFLQIVFIAGGGTALIVVLSSSDLRTRLRVFLIKHFFSNKYDYREEWLGLIGSLSATADGLSPPERSVSAVASIFASPGGAVWLHREDEGFVPAGQWRLELPAEAELGAESPLPRFLAERNWVVELAEYQRYPERYGDLTLPDWLEALPRVWMIVPLPHQDRLLGFMVLTKPQMPTEVTWEDRDLFKTLGREIAIYLAQHEDARALSQARQFEAFNRLTTFLMHDLKNLIAQQSLVVKNAEKHKHNPEFVDDAIATIGGSVRRMEALLEHLRRQQSHGRVERVSVQRVLEQAVARCYDRAPTPSLHGSDQSALVELDPEGLTMVLLHLIRNAQEAADEHGRVVISLTNSEQCAIITIEDDGEGMSAAFIRERLFQPFYSTKASKGMGIGAHQAREFVRAAGGRLSVKSQQGVGTCFRIELPVVMAEASESVDTAG